jgi:hypothetical protein
MAREGARVAVSDLTEEPNHRRLEISIPASLRWSRLASGDNPNFHAYVRH